MKLIAIDDQQIILDDLKQKLSSSELPLTQVDTATGADMARALFDRTEYDIALCDIEMPGENGFGFAEWLLREHPKCKLIFLTAHMDAPYLKRAIELKSFDYLLQPARQTELYRCIQKAVLELKLEKRRDDLVRKGELYNRRNREYLDWHFCRYLMGEEELSAELREYLPDKLHGASPSCSALLIVRVLNSEGPLNQMSAEDADYILCNMLDELLSPLNSRAWFVRKSPGCFVGLISCGEELTAEELSDALRPLSRYMKELADTPISAFLSPTAPFSSVRQLFEKTDRAAAEQKNPAEGLTLVSGDSGQHLLSSMEKLWSQYLYAGDFDRLGISLSEYLKSRSSSPLFDEDQLTEIHDTFTRILFSYLSEGDYRTETIFSGDLTYSDYMTGGLTPEAFLSMIPVLTVRLKTACLKNIDPVSTAIRFIREHLEEDISVTEIAERACLSPEHLTRLFRKKTGCSLKEYLTNERMAVAKMMLKTTPLSITLISSHVGYSNYNNFGKVFQKYVGCTPSEYRESGEPSAENNAE